MSAASLLPIHRVVEFMLAMIVIALAVLYRKALRKQSVRAAAFNTQLQYLAAIVESSQDAIVGKDSRGIVTSWNLGAEKIFGYTSSEMIGESITRLLPADRLAEEEDILARILRNEKVHHFDTVRVTKAGQQIHVSLSISPIKDADGNVIGASKIARDITATFNLQEQLRHSQKMQALGQLASGIAHDLNNTLAIVIGNLDVTPRLKSEVERHRNLDTALKAALRGADLARRLLDFSRTRPLDPVPLHLSTAIAEMLDMASAVLGPDIAVGTHFDQFVPLVRIDPSGFATSLLNLVSNARDAMPAGGALRLTTSLAHLDEQMVPSILPSAHTRPYACVTISDNGLGMTPEVYDRVFEPFFTTKPDNRGTGLGLTMVNGFMHQSQGIVRIYSVPNYGTTVFLYFPIPEQHRQPAEPPAPPQALFHDHGTVLLVDDEQDLLDPAVTYLTDLGYTILRSLDCIGALAVLAAHPAIDLLVTDILMPGGMNGIELAELVTRQRPHIKILISSGFPYDALIHKNLNLEEHQLLQKPYRLADLGNAIRNQLDGPAI